MIAPHTLAQRQLAVEVARRARLARQLSGMTQREAADALDVTERTYARWETAETQGFLGKLERVAALFDTTREALLGEAPAGADGVAEDLAALRAQVDELRALLLDPKRLAAESKALAAEAKAPRPRRSRARSASTETASRSSSRTRGRRSSSPSRSSPSRSTRRASSRRRARP